jgi:hypothetical protein
MARLLFVATLRGMNLPLILTDPFEEATCLDCEAVGVITRSGFFDGTTLHKHCLCDPNGVKFTLGPSVPDLALAIEHLRVVLPGFQVYHCNHCGAPGNGVSACHYCKTLPQ